MATYAIGDIHGCFEEFQRLLDAIDFDPSADRIWHAGDLVNGGPDSLSVLRWFRDHDDVATTVLGNHDLHLVAVAYNRRRIRSKDTFDDVLETERAAELIAWLRRRPLMVRNGDTAMVHAGILPEWTVGDAEEAAREVEELLSSPKPQQLLDVMYGNKPRCLDDADTVEKRWRLFVNVFTRMRVLRPDGDLDFEFKSTYEEIPKGHTAWFDAEKPAWSDHRILCGHWSALGFRNTERVVALDSGCRWGGELTAFRLDDERVFQVESTQPEVFG